MSAWPGKYVIGLTGNIATGKSVVRKMLEHLGAYGIDADALGHRAIARGAPGYQPVVDHFGRWILAPDGQIDRVKLGRLVFSDPEALAQLENIVHPLVRQALDILIQKASQRVIVIEAIKLIESSVRTKCDTLWVVYAPYEVQFKRLVEKRNMPPALAQQRIQSQPPQEKKVAAANFVIRNDRDFGATWRQVLAGWNQVLAVVEIPLVEEPESAAGELTVQRARPRQSGEIASLIGRLSGGSRPVSADEIMAAFAEKAFLLTKKSGAAVGVAGWRVENLVACTDDVLLDPSLAVSEGLAAVLAEVERSSRELQCEVSLLFLPESYAAQRGLLQDLGYQARSIQELGVRAWEEAALEAMKDGLILFIKPLRKDRVLRPVY